MTAGLRASLSQRPTPHVVVVGAGAFGGWTALFLRYAGARVTLLDSWGPGNSRSSSGGDTRVFRSTYGPTRLYVRLAKRALALWREHELRWERKLFTQTGLLWMVGEDDSYERAAIPVLEQEQVRFRELSTDEARTRYPQVDFAGVRWVLWEEETGYLRAREACQAVVMAFQALGGTYRSAAAQPLSALTDGPSRIRLTDGTSVAGDVFVFAAGPWLPQLFPDLLGDRLAVTRQQVLFFATPPGDPRFDETHFPVWADHGERFIYGVPGNDRRGFKIADDTPGARFDPTNEDRLPNLDQVRWLRAYMGWRFPLLMDAPLREARVCQYAMTPDTHFIVDRHPRAENVWLVGGGSGHGFKHGPAIGELVAGMVLGRQPPEPTFQLNRFLSPNNRE